MKKIIKKNCAEIDILRQEKKESMDIAIIGMSFKLPNANTQEEFWNIINEQKNCSICIPDERKKISIDIAGCYGKENMAFRKMSYIRNIDSFDYNFFGMSKTEASLIDPNQRLFLENTIQAIEDAGYGISGIKSTKTGVYVGHDNSGEYKYFVERVMPEFEKISSVENLPAMIPARVSHFLDLQGPSMIINTTCSSSLVALHIACKALSEKECDMAIVGGVKVSLVPIERETYIRKKGPDGTTRVFDENANGATSGEGVVTILIKSLEQAVQDNDNIYAVIKGGAINHNGNGASVMAPNPIAEEELLINAWKNAKVNPETISYIECHSVGTKWGDSIEIEGIQKAFDRYTHKAQFCAIGSIKTNIGHLDCVSGLAGLVKVILSLKNRVIPPSLPLESPNKNINFDSGAVYYNDTAVPWNRTPYRCGVSASGLNGTNCHLVLEGFYRKNDTIREKKEEYIFTLSAKTPDLLNKSIRDFIIYLQNVSSEICDLGDICYTVNTSRGQYSYRILCIAKNKKDLLIQLCELDRTFKKFKFSNRISNKGMDDLQLMDKLLVDYKLTGNRNILMQIKELYYKGVRINWNLYYEKAEYYRVSVPTYHFENSKCWIQDYKQNKLEDITLEGRHSGKYTYKERIIGKLIANLLDLSTININRSFIELGGNSILAVKLEIDLEKENMYAFDFNECIKQSIKNLSELVYFKSEVHAGSEIDTNNKSVDFLSDKDNMRVFNDVYYKSCFYNALFTILQSCNYQIGYFFTNDFIEYKTDYNGLICVEYHEQKSCKQILNEAGVKYISEKYIIDVIEYATNEINKGNILLIWIDPYYASIRKDTYMKKHRAHPWVVSNVDMRKKVFTIYEHTNSDSLNYQKQRVSFDEIKICYESYISIYTEDLNGYSCYSFSRAHEMKKTIDFKCVYFSNLLNYKNKIDSNLNAQILFIDILTKHLPDKDYLKENSEDIMRALNELINAKKIEKYMYESVFENASVFRNVLVHIVEEWEHIRNILLKYFITGNLPEKLQLVLNEKVLSVKEYEKKLYSLLMQ